MIQTLACMRTCVCVARRVLSWRSGRLCVCVCVLSLFLSKKTQREQAHHNFRKKHECICLFRVDAVLSAQVTSRRVVLFCCLPVGSAHVRHAAGSCGATYHNRSLCARKADSRAMGASEHDDRSVGVSTVACVAVVDGLDDLRRITISIAGVVSIAIVDGFDNLLDHVTCIAVPVTVAVPAVVPLDCVDDLLDDVGVGPVASVRDDFVNHLLWNIDDGTIRRLIRGHEDGSVRFRFVVIYRHRLRNRTYTLVQHGIKLATGRTCVHEWLLLAGRRCRRWLRGEVLHQVLPDSCCPLVPTDVRA